MDYLQRVRDKNIIPKYNSRQIKTDRLKKVSNRKELCTYGKQKGSIMDFEVNVRTMMAAFYCGTGAKDIAHCTSFLGVPGGKSCERSFSRHSPKMCKLITSVINGVIAVSLRNEIVVTIAAKLSQMMTEGEMKISTAAYFTNNTQHIPDVIRKLGIAVSYDMGWQKRLTR